MLALQMLAGLALKQRVEKTRKDVALCLIGEQFCKRTSIFSSERYPSLEGQNTTNPGSEPPSIHPQVAAELERSLPHGMRAFERVSRTIQRLCNGYTSLPGLLEWGRITAARLESTTAAGGRCGLDGSVTTDSNTRGSLHASCRSGGSTDAARDGKVFVSLTRGATAAAPRARGGGNHDRHVDGMRGPGTQQPGSAAGVGSMGNHRTPSLAFLSGAGFRSTEHPFGGGVWASSVSTAPYYSSGPSSASTASLPGRVYNTINPSRDTPAAQEHSCHLPKRAIGAGGRPEGEGRIGDVRKEVWMAGHTNVGGSSTRGVICAAEYGGGGGEVSSSGDHRTGGGDGADGGSSVASLLREDRAFKRTIGALG